MMLRRTLRWIRRHKAVTAGTLLLLAFLFLNVIAFFHARSMTHYTAPGGGHTLSPDRLSFVQKVSVLFTGVKLPRPQNRYTPAAIPLPYTVHQIPSSDGIQLEAWHVPADARSSQSQPRDLVLVFPGYSAAKSFYLKETKVFHDLGCDVLLVDFRGCGASSGMETTIGWREANDVQAALAYARKTFTPRHCILFGDSMGGAAVLRAISIHDDVRPDGLILDAPYDRLLSTVEHRFTTMGLPSFPASRLLVFWGGVQLRFSPFAMEPVKSAASVRCPTLLLQGADDAWVLGSEAESVFNALGTTRKHLIIFDHAGHQPLLGVDPDQWKRALETHLHSLD